MTELTERLVAVRDRMKALTKQGEDNVWRPAKDAVEVMADAANVLAGIDAAARFGKTALAAWDKYEPDASRDRIADQACEMAEALRLILQQVPHPHSRP